MVFCGPRIIMRLEEELSLILLKLVLNYCNSLSLIIVILIVLNFINKEQLGLF